MGAQTPTNNTGTLRGKEKRPWPGRGGKGPNSQVLVDSIVGMMLLYSCSSRAFGGIQGLLGGPQHLPKAPLGALKVITGKQASLGRQKHTRIQKNSNLDSLI